MVLSTGCSPWGPGSPFPPEPQLTRLCKLCACSSRPPATPTPLTDGIIDGVVSGLVVGVAWRGAVMLADKVGVKEHIEKARDKLRRKSAA